MSVIEDRIAKAEQRAAKQNAYAEQLRRIATAEAEIPNVYRTGEVSKAKLAETYGISSMTVTRILTDNGIEGTTVRRLNDEEKKEVAGLIKAGEDLDQVAESYGVSRNAVRQIGLKAGVLQPGQRKPHRSDSEYELIEQFDQEARARFGGAGLFNLGTGLRNWQAKRRSEASGAPVPTPAEAHGDVGGAMPPTPEVSDAPSEGTDPVAPAAPAPAAPTTSQEDYRI